MPPVTIALLAARARACGIRQLAVVAALAIASVLPILIDASGIVTADAALERGLADLPATQRTAVVSYNGFLAGDAAAGADALARRELPALVSGPIRRQVVYRTLADSAGRSFVLTGTDDLGTAVRITSGRAPASCTPSRCEVVVIAGAGVNEPVLRSGYGLQIVGRAVRTDPLLLAGSFDPGPQTPVLLGDGVDRVAAILPLELIQRSYGWIAPLAARGIISAGVDGWIKAAGVVADRLTIALPGMVLFVPDQSVRAQVSRARSSAQRFSLLAGGCGVLLLGSALIGGAALRPDHARFITALRRRGLSPARIRAVVAGEALALSATGAVFGVLLGFAVAAVLASRAGLPVGSSAVRAVRGGLPRVSALSLGSLALLLLALWPQAGRPALVRERAAWRSLWLAAAGSLFTLLLVLSRGAAPDPGGGADPLLISLPALVLLTLGLATAATWPWLLLLAGRLLPRRALGSRLAIAGIAARPLFAASTVALLAAAVGATGFAASYSATLQRGAADQAAFAVPMTARLSPGTGLRPVLALAPVAGYAGIAPGAHAVPVLRQAGSIRSGSQGADVVQVIGVPPAALVEVRRWSSVTGGPEAAGVARAITTGTPASGLRLPAGQVLSIRAGGSLAAVALTGWVRADDGRERSVPLAPSGAGVLTGRLPAPDGLTKGTASAGWSLIALSLSQPTDSATQRQHALGEDSNGKPVPAGRLDLKTLAVDGVSLARPWAGWNGSGLKVLSAGASATLDYRLIASSLVLNAAPPGPGVVTGSTAGSAASTGSAIGGPALPVAADPATAAAGPLITLTLNGVPVQARVVATLPRFPTVTGRFVIADGTALAALVDRSAPGTGQPGELWLDLPGSSAPARGRLAAAPFSGVQAQWSADLERGLRTDPVAEGARQVLALAAALTLLVGLTALVLLVAGERVEDAGEFYAWEANGVRGRVLRRALWIRAVLMSVVAVPAGVLGGLVLTRLTARLVNLTAGAGLPQPPLVAVAGVRTALPAVLIGLVVALAVAALVAGAAFREPVPVLEPGRGRR